MDTGKSVIIGERLRRLRDLPQAETICTLREGPFMSSRIAIGRIVLVLALALALAVPLAAAAQSIQVGDAWVRPTLPGQKATGAYLELTSVSNAALVAAGSTAAARVEMHTMSTEGGVMRMRALPRIDLPAGQTVKLAPNGMHLMLFEVKE